MIMESEESNKEWCDTRAMMILLWRCAHLNDGAHEEDRNQEGARLKRMEIERERRIEEPVILSRLFLVQPAQAVFASDGVNDARWRHDLEGHEICGETHSTAQVACVRACVRA